MADRDTHPVIDTVLHRVPYPDGNTHSHTDPNGYSHFLPHTFTVPNPEPYDGMKRSRTVVLVEMDLPDWDGDDVCDPCSAVSGALNDRYGDGTVNATHLIVCDAEPAAADTTVLDDYR